MSNYPSVNRLSLPDVEEDTLDWWAEHNVFERTIAEREGAPAYTFYEGPPTANGRPGIHHVMARSIKDIFCRYKTMQGFQVARKAGWDTHGLPVEIEIEKRLDLQSRADIEEYGIEAYNAACRDSVLEYKDLWDELTTRMGYWVDLDDPYVTFETDYIETLWWLIKQIHEKGLLYKGYKIQWYSPGSHTVLSSHEVSLGYEETQDPSVYIRFPVHGEQYTYFLAWTTTPWTLISNTALAVGTDLTYVRVQHDDPHQGSETLIMAEALVDTVLGDEPYDIVETIPGSDLVGQRYEPVFPYFTDRVGQDAAWRVVSADIVSTEDGTGIVHMAPAYGEEDYAVAQEHDLPLFNPIDADGCFTEEAPLVEGEWFKDADKKITTDLKKRGLLYKHETYLHNYPHDWRKGTPLMSYPVESWFIETTAVKERMVELNDTINWQPPGVGEGRFGEWLENNIDWALSRRRYWGTPLPIWQSDEDPEYVEVIGSVEELRAKCGDQLPDDHAEIDLHRPFVDDLTWPAPDEVGGTMRRVPDLIDVWFDSGAMPFAQWHYPFENKEQFERNFPADFIAEGVDQTRGWFYTLHALATLIMDDVAYKNVVVNGLVLDDEGNKMSKSKGNTLEPFEVIDEFGADVVRWYMMSNTPPWENIRFSKRGLRDLRRKFFGTLENVYSFFATYANIDNYTYTGDAVPLDERLELDQWIISRLQTTQDTVIDALDDYHPTNAARAVEQFVDDLSNWYLRRSRRRFWASKQSGDAAPATDTVSATDKQAAYDTVYECLEAVARMMSPIAPFFGEWLYGALHDDATSEGNSVHLASFPTPDAARRNEALEHRMGLARTISSVVLSLRNEAEINVRQPLQRVLVVTGTGVEEATVEQVRDIILDEVNVKTIEYVDGSSAVVKRSATPNFSRLGPRLGSLMPAVNKAVRALDDDAIGQYLDQGYIELDVEDETVRLGEDDLEISSAGIEGWLVEQHRDVTVALDTQITDALRTEGLARESVKRIQNLRKDAEFDVTDRIAITYDGSTRIQEALTAYGDWIRNETLALELQPSDQPTGEATRTFEIGDEHLTVGIQRVAR